MAELQQQAPREGPRDLSPPEGLSQQEMENNQAAELPDREAMSLINANIAIPVNAAVAANVLSDNANAYADAAQDATVDQGT